MYEGVTAEYSGDQPVPPRTRGFRYKLQDVDNTNLTLSKLWKDISKRRMFLCTTDTISLDGAIESTPTTTVVKKNPDRSIILGRMAIADLRRINLKFNTQQYYPIVVPAIYDLARWIMSLVNLYRGLPLKATKRNVASAFRLLRLHPALSLVMVTEFPADHVHLANDLVCF